MSSRRNRKMSGKLQVGDLYAIMEVHSRCYETQKETQLIEAQEF